MGVAEGRVASCNQQPRPGAAGHCKRQQLDSSSSSSSWHLFFTEVALFNHPSRMATPGRGVRATRKLRQWTVEQVESGKYRGLVWDDPPKKTMFRIPWKHAGKQEFHHEEDAAFFKAWAIFKGKYRPGERFDPAAGKTRIRCALFKSPEFEEVPSRSKLDITEPYKVYRLVPPSEQPIVNTSKKSKKMKSECSRGTSAERDGRATSEATASLSLNATATLTFHKEEFSPQSDETAPDMTEIALHLEAEIVPAEIPLVMSIGEFSVQLSILYSGVLIQRFFLPEGDFRITSAAPPSEGPRHRMRCVMLPPPERLEDSQKQRDTQQLLKDLEKGVMVDSNREGIFIQCQRRCKANISWKGFTKSLAVGKLNSDTFLQVFSTKAFQAAWDQHKLGFAPIPEHQVTLCVGEELEGNDSLNNKLIIIQMAQNFAARMT
ncbi:interferon regulatory factor 9 isoform X2 [Sphaerodactylus townsendi]|uniref:interferon regulatory factor 9 isoform X2 n=1 Tax=Sphaerodactylus townsendi TaxID=933632 RepID=UPI0020268B28|nr:interferon regulatory factor 9 isoform X2 [Sphaerodactylus townsendi]